MFLESFIFHEFLFFSFKIDDAVISLTTQNEYSVPAVLFFPTLVFLEHNWLTYTLVYHWSSDIFDRRESNFLYLKIEDYNAREALKVYMKFC